jgi:uncharacterized protein YdiU (UPF0061 family)
MTAAITALELDDSFVRELTGLYEPWRAATAPEPRLLALNESLAVELGVDPASLRTPDGIALLVGNAEPVGSTPIAQAYAGHQFGGYSPRLGDGRALLLGEVIDRAGRRRDLHLKGSGRTPFARGGDGKAVIGPMLREYLIGEALHALGIPTTRALAVVATGETVARETPQPGAVLARVAASHLRVGTFQYASATGDADLLQRLVDYAIARHHPTAADAERPALALLDAVVGVQAELIARWMLVGFIHGVMNTDNMTISGESIDFGPCAFMDGFDPATVFSSIDHQGRYAYGNQPAIGQWNLARLAEALLPLIDPDTDRAVELATESLRSYAVQYEAHWDRGLDAKLGLDAPVEADPTLATDFVAAMSTTRADFTATFRALARELRGVESPPGAGLPDDPAFAAWVARWRARVSGDPSAVADAMDARNPISTPRNHLVEHALGAAMAGDLAPFDALVAVLREPFTERPGLEQYALGAPDSFAGYRTFCGT